MSFVWGVRRAPSWGRWGDAWPSRGRCEVGGATEARRPTPRLLIGAQSSAQHVIGRTDDVISLVLLTGVPADWSSSLVLLVIGLLEK